MGNSSGMGTYNFLHLSSDIRQDIGDRKSYYRKPILKGSDAVIEYFNSLKYNTTQPFIDAMIEELKYVFKGEL